MFEENRRVWRFWIFEIVLSDSNSPRSQDVEDTLHALGVLLGIDLGSRGRSARERIVPAIAGLIVAVLVFATRSLREVFAGLETVSSSQGIFSPSVCAAVAYIGVVTIPGIAWSVWERVWKKRRRVWLQPILQLCFLSVLFFHSLSQGGSIFNVLVDEIESNLLLAAGIPTLLLYAELPFQWILEAFGRWRV